MAWSATYCQQHADPYITGPQAYDLGRLTRFVPLNPSGAGPVLYCDDDSTVDVDFRDRHGRPWFWYRAREGQYTLHASWHNRNGGSWSWYSAREERNTPGNGANHFSRKLGNISELRGTGILDPLGLRPTPFRDTPPWYAYVLEPDVLAGRRGVAGWDGNTFDRGLCIRDEVLEKAAFKTEWGNWGWETWACIIGGAVVAVIAIPITGGMSAGLLAAVLAGAGFGSIGYGLHMGTAGEAFSPGKFALYVGGGAVAGAASAAAFTGTIGFMASHGIGTTLGMSIASTGAAGAAGGAMRGLIMGSASAWMEGEGFWESLSAGGHQAATGAAYGVIGGIVSGGVLNYAGASLPGALISGFAGGAAVGGVSGYMQHGWEGVLPGVAQGGITGMAFAGVAWGIGRVGGMIRPLPPQPKTLPDPRDTRYGRLLIRTKPGKREDLGLPTKSGMILHHRKYLSFGGPDAKGNIAYIPVPDHTGRGLAHPGPSVVNARTPYGTIFY